MKSLKNLSHKIMQRSKSDAADSALVIFVVLVPLLIIIMGFVSDLNKNVNARAAFTTAAQESAQSSIRTVDGSGNLNQSTVNAFVTEYRYQVNPAAEHTNEISAYKSASCDTVNVNGVQRKAPYIVVHFEGERSGSSVATSGTWVIEGATGTIPTNVSITGASKVIEAEVYDSSVNNWGVFGLPQCQTHHSTVSAISFGSNEDLSSKEQN